jgi:predicted translin family RNA/ssDNA-binding protein
MSIQLAIFGLLSLREISHTFKLFEPYFKGGIPCYTTIQMWLLRFGLFRLKHSIKKRDDWVYIIDHTIESGPNKCFVILGVHGEQFKNNIRPLKHKDVSVLSIEIVQDTSAKAIETSLRALSEKTERPVQIISDGCSSINKAIRGFNNNEKTYSTHTYDATHKAAIILKHILDKNKKWQEFINKIAFTKRCLIQTELSYLMPQRPRDKSRWLNIDIFMNWSWVILNTNKEKLSSKNKEKFEEKLSWIEEFKKEIEEWSVILEIVNSLKNEVRQNGLEKTGTKRRFLKSIKDLKINTKNTRKAKKEAVEYIKYETNKLNGINLGCSDVIESMFGKYKIFSKRGPMREISKSVLLIPVFTGKITYKEVKNAMEEISVNNVKKWLSDNIGETIFAKRKKVFKHKRGKVA